MHTRFGLTSSTYKKLPNYCPHGVIKQPVTQHAIHFSFTFLLSSFFCSTNHQGTIYESLVNSSEYIRNQFLNPIQRNKILCQFFLILRAQKLLHPMHIQLSKNHMAYRLDKFRSPYIFSTSLIEYKQKRIFFIYHFYIHLPRKTLKKLSFFFSLSLYSKERNEHENKKQYNHSNTLCLNRIYHINKKAL